MMHKHRATIVEANDSVGDILYAANPADAMDQVLLPSFDVKARRGVLIGALHGRDYLAQTDPGRRHFFGGDDHLIFLSVSTDGRDLRDSWNRKKPRPDRPIGR